MSSLKFPLMSLLHDFVLLQQYDFVKDGMDYFLVLGAKWQQMCSSNIEPLTNLLRSEGP